MTNRTYQRARKHLKRNQKQMEQLLAKPLEVVTCRNGHPAFLTTRWIRRQLVYQREAFQPLGKHTHSLPKEIVPDTLDYKYYVCQICGFSCFTTGGFWVRGKLRGSHGRYVYAPYQKN